MKQNRVAACLILGDSFKDSELEKLFKSLESHVQGIFVAYNGTKLHPGELEKELRTYLSTHQHRVHLKKFKWEDNFGLARQQSFDMVPEEFFEWKMWIDSDDVFKVEEGKTLQDILADIDPYSKGLFVRYDYAIEPSSGRVVVEQWRERVLSTSAKWEWRYPIHEVCAGEPGIQFSRRNDLWIEHLRKSGEDRGARERNRRIIAKALRENPEEPRFMFYFAGETMAEADSTSAGPKKKELADAAIMAFENYKVLVGEINDDYYLAQTRISELHRMKNDHAKAINSDLDCIAIYPGWPDGYIGAAKSCMELEDYPRMKAFADVATKLSKPMTVSSIEPMNTTFYPYFLRAIAEEHLGEFDQALRDYRKARKYWNPPTGLLDEKIKLLKNHEKIGENGDDKDQRKSLRGTKPDKSVCFYSPPIPEAWHPKLTKEKGAGGAEICVMELAQRFAADGWRTVVFGTPGEHRGVYEGVEYWDSNEFLPAEEFKVFVSSRSPGPFEVDINAKLKMIWMHDVNIGESFLQVADKPDLIIGLSKWHVDHMSKLYGIKKDRFEIIPNGINTERFKKDRSRDISRTPKFVYSSSPDRGLDTLLSLWPFIRNRYPEAEAHIYYGWNMIDKIINIYRQSGQVHYLEQFKASILGQINNLGGEDAGIFTHGRVNQEELANAMYENNFWTYPTSFMETSCITALEVQAAGVIPVTSNLAALKETVAIDGLKVEGWPMNLDYQNQWFNLLSYLIEEADDEELTNIRSTGREFALKFNWNSAYEKWIKLIEDKCSQ